MNITALDPTTDKTAWADLLAASFERPQQAMIRLLEYLLTWYPLIAFGAWEGDRLLGQYSCLLREVSVPGCDHPVKVGMSINMAVRPEARGRGLVKHMAAPVYESVRAAGAIAGVGFSNPAGVSVDQHSRAYGYHILGQMVNTVTLLSGSSSACPAIVSDEWPVESFQTTGNNCLIHFADDITGLRHQFVHHPSHTFHYATAHEGIVIFDTVQHGPIGEASVLGWAGPDHPALLKSFVSAVRQRGIGALRAVITPALIELFRPMGTFVRVPFSHNPYYLTVKPLDESGEALLDFDQWACTGGHIL